MIHSANACSIKRLPRLRNDLVGFAVLFVEITEAGEDHVVLDAIAHVASHARPTCLFQLVGDRLAPGVARIGCAHAFIPSSSSSASVTVSAFSMIVSTRRSMSRSPAQRPSA